MKLKLLVFINVDWYCALHWQDRLTYWSSIGIETHLLTNFSDPALRRKLELNGIQCHHVKFKRKSIDPFGAIRVIWTFIKLIHDLRPDLVHTITIKPNILGGLIASYYRIPTLLSVTGLGRAFDKTAPLYFVIARFLTINIYKLISSYEKNHFVFENASDRTLLIEHDAVLQTNASVVNGAGIDTDKFKPVARQTGTNVLFASRLIWSKGLKDLIEAKRLATGSEKDFHLFVAGIVDCDVNDSIPLSYLEELHEEGLITWLGQVDDMPRLLETVDLVVLPSTYKEGIPRILIEAASCGKPLIATDIPGCRDIVINGSNGILVPPHSALSVLHAIDEILKNPLIYQNYSKASRKLVLERYSNSIVYEQFLSIFRKINRSTELPPLLDSN